MIMIYGWELVSKSTVHTPFTSMIFTCNMLTSANLITSHLIFYEIMIKKIFLHVFLLSEIENKLILIIFYNINSIW